MNELVAQALAHFQRFVDTVKPLHNMILTVAQTTGQNAKLLISNPSGNVTQTISGGITTQGPITISGSYVFTGNGSGLTNLNASNISSGSISSSLLTSLNATNLTSGSVPVARLTDINATYLTSGTVPTARLPIATTSALGAVKVDGTSIVINPTTGVISSVVTGQGNTNATTLLGLVPSTSGTPSTIVERTTTGQVVVGADPTANLEVATKQYVDTAGTTLQNNISTLSNSVTALSTNLSTNYTSTTNTTTQITQATSKFAPVCLFAVGNLNAMIGSNQIDYFIVVSAFTATTLRVSCPQTPSSGMLTVEVLKRNGAGSLYSGLTSLQTVSLLGNGGLNFATVAVNFNFVANDILLLKVKAASLGFVDLRVELF